MEKNEIIQKIDQLKSYSIQQKTSENPDNLEECISLFSSLMQPLYSAVNAYFSADRSAFTKPMNLVAEQMRSMLWDELSKWEIPCPTPSASGAPASYNDLTELFYKFGWITTTNDTFYNAWKYKVPESSGGTTTTELDPIPDGNPLIDSWVAEINSAVAKELKNVNDLNLFLENAICANSPYMLWEDTGNLESSPETKDLAKVIFVDRKFKFVCDKFNIPAYIPTYLRG